MKSFNVYETIGIIAPGVVFLLCLKWVMPDWPLDLEKLEISIGGFGIATIIAFVVGHLLQSIGNLFEKVLWCFRGGWPSDWPRSGEHDLLSEHQIALLQARIESLLGLENFALDTSTSATSWRSVFRQIYAFVSSKNNDTRAISFNATYGLFRGIVSCMLVLVTVGIVNWQGASGKALFSFVVVLIIAVIRMERFGVHYAREVFVQFLNQSESSEVKDE